MKNNCKDTRLWEKRRKALNFVTRSQKLALDIMKEVEMSDFISELYIKGEILTTCCNDPLSNVTISKVSQEEQSVINALSTSGLEVYHVFHSNKLIGRKTEIQGDEFDIATFEKLVSLKSYLCVPKDIYNEATSIEKDLSNVNHETVTKEYIQHSIFMASLGLLSAYVVVENDMASSHYGFVEVSKRGEDIVVVS